MRRGYSPLIVALIAASASSAPAVGRPPRRRPRPDLRQALHRELPEQERAGTRRGAEGRRQLGPRHRALQRPARRHERDRARPEQHLRARPRQRADPHTIPASGVFDLRSAHRLRSERREDRRVLRRPEPVRLPPAAGFAASGAGYWLTRAAARRLDDDAAAARCLRATCPQSRQGDAGADECDDHEPGRAARRWRRRPRGHGRSQRLQVYLYGDIFKSVAADCATLRAARSLVLTIGAANQPVGCVEVVPGAV